MTRVRAEATIQRSPQDVFEFVTTPANWPLWHPSSVRVTGDCAHSQIVGERCVEEFIVAGRHGECEWTVLERDAPRRWVIDARPPAGGGARIIYDLTASGVGTQFIRTMDYEMPNAFLELMNALVIRRKIERESAQAVANLREVLETTVAATR